MSLANSRREHSFTLYRVLRFIFVADSHFITFIRAVIAFRLMQAISQVVRMVEV